MTPPNIKEAVTLDEVLAIASAPVNTTVERRIRAAAEFWYLSGIRIGAFNSLPILAVDISKIMVMQHPNLGVRTKNGKYDTTYLLPIPELLDVVRQWDEEVRAILPETGFGFAPLSPDTGEIDTNCKEIGEHRPNLARRNLRV
ncbi:MAG: hypothetical protein PVF74_04715, partial [Anaerolineales bacterium]|jgi:site-specific recombinase XerC